MKRLMETNVTHALAQVCIGYLIIFLFQNHFLVIDWIANDKKYSKSNISYSYK
jgi:lipid-A-disaccharide synthase-like uncharacterized protein